MNYQYKWRRYRLWCRREGHTASVPASQKFADFLLHLHQDCHLSLSAVKGYKAMLNSVFRFKGFDLSTDPVLRDVIRACGQRLPRTRLKLPPWNVDVVLRHLMGAPFEPMATSSCRLLTQKTLFLVALATAKRVGELQALSSHVAFQGCNMVLSYLPDFVAKTETPAHPLPREFLLSSLSEAVGHQDEERLLCPVRALRWYLDRTRNPSRPRHLFLSVRDPSRPLSKAALSFFLRQLIRSAHKDFPDHLAPALRVRAHDIRGVATSLLWSLNRAVSDVMAVACWRTQSVFANHYLSSVQRVQDDVFSIGPIVAAGSVIP